MRYLLSTNTGYEHLKKKFKRAVSTHVGQDRSKMPVCVQVLAFFASLLCLFACALARDKLLLLNHISADDETSNV